MTEQEKMKKGYLWEDDEENMALQTRGLVNQFNSLPPGSMNERAELLKKIFGSVGENVWIGANVVVLPGVTIGENSVIGAGSVATKDIPANVVAFGVPCKVFREINEHDDEYYFKDRRFDEQPE